MKKYKLEYTGDEVRDLLGKTESMAFISGQDKEKLDGIEPMQNADIERILSM